MKNTRTLNMTSGNPAHLLIVFALPMLVGNLFQQGYNLVDSIIVGKYVGSAALAAVGATGSVTFLFFSVSYGISSGAGIVTSQYFGAGEDSRIRRAITNAAYIMFIASLAMGILAFIAAPWILTLMETPADILPDAILYMRISCLGVPLVGVYNYASSMLRALGDSRTPLYFLILSCFLNIAMDLLFVCVFDMGVSGAAVATIVAQFIAGGSCLLYAFKTNPYFKLSRSDFRIDRKVIYQSIRLGLPLSMQSAMIAVSTSVLQAFVNSFGTAAVAAFTATSRIEQLIHQFYSSLGTSLATYAGQNCGAGKIDRIKAGLKYCLLMSAAFSLLMLVVNQLFGTPIISIFVDDPEVIQIGARALRLTSWFYIFLGTIFITRSVLNGIGDAIFSFINGVVEMLSRIFLPMLMALIPTVGMWGIWWTAGLAWFISAVFCVLRYLSWRKKWKINQSLEDK